MKIKQQRLFQDKKEVELLISAYMELAFYSGRWAGQVDLEESIDCDQYMEAFVESISARQTTMPSKKASKGREATIYLRSDEWRKGVRNSTKLDLEKYIKELTEKINEKI